MCKSFMQSGKLKWKVGNSSSYFKHKRDEKAQRKLLKSKEHMRKN